MTLVGGGPSAVEITTVANTTASLGL